MFLVRTMPKLYESLSSWRQRAGTDNGFRIYPRGKGMRRATDPDRLPANLELDWIKQQLVIETRSLEPLTLNHWLPKLTGSGESTFTRHWVLPLGSKRAASQSGPMICPACITNDEDPYIRLHWRAAFLTRCPIHHQLLIDRCPGCHAPLWPAVRKPRDPKTWVNLYQCFSCGLDLRGVNNRSLDSSGIEQFGAQWIANTAQHFFSPAKTWGEALDALWTVCQLLIRRRSMTLWEQIPKEYSRPKIESTKGARIESIEGLNVNIRDHLLAAALWLLEDWPDRFVGACQASGISRRHFYSSQVYHPQWLQARIDDELTHHRRDQVSIHQIDAASAKLEQGGQPVTKSAVRRELGVSESRAIDAVLGQRRQATFKELLKLCGVFESEIKYSSTARDQRATLIRDYLIFLVSTLCRIPIEDVCVMTHKQIQSRLARISKHADSSNPVLIYCRRTEEIDALYAREVYPKFYDKTTSGEFWFLGRNGAVMAGHSTRDRSAKLIKKHFPADLWNSADAFLHALHGTAPRGRRADRTKYNDYQIDLFQ